MAYGRSFSSSRTTAGGPHESRWSTISGDEGVRGEVHPASGGAAEVDVACDERGEVGDCFSLPLDFLDFLEWIGNTVDGEAVDNVGVAGDGKDTCVVAGEPEVWLPVASCLVIATF